MGKVSQHFMEQIEENHEFQSLVNPRFSSEPEPDYDGELIHWAKRILENAESLLFQRDLVTQSNIMSVLKQQLDHTRFLAGKHYQRLSEQIEAEREEREEEQREYDGMQDVYAGARADFM